MRWNAAITAQQLLWLPANDDIGKLCFEKRNNFQRCFADKSQRAFKRIRENLQLAGTHVDEIILVLING